MIEKALNIDCKLNDKNGDKVGVQDLLVDDFNLPGSSKKVVKDEPKDEDVGLLTEALVDLKLS